MTLSPIRSALILAATTALAGVLATPSWAQMPRPNFPIRQDSAVAESQPASDPAPVREEPPMPAQPEPEGVQAKPLDAPAVRREAPPPAATPAYAPPPAATTSTRAPSRAPAPAPVRTVTKATVTGKVVDAEGPARSYTVKKRDTLDSISKSLGVDMKDLAEQNGLKKPYRLMPGMVLKGPRSDAKAYVVGSGDTLYAIAKRFSVTPQALAEANGMRVGGGLTPGRRLILPDGYKDKGAQRVQVEEAAAAPEPTPAPTLPAHMTRRERRAAEAEARKEAAAEREAPEASSTVRTSVTGKVVEFTGKPMVYRVRKGDAVDTIAHDMGMNRKEFADLNKLKPPYALHPGQVLKGPPEQHKAYVPVEGDTLALIAKRFGVTPKALAAENGMRSTAPVRPGKRLTLPDGFRDRGPIKETVRVAPAEPTYTPPPRSQPTPYTPPPSSAPYNPPPATTPPTTYNRPTTPVPPTTYNRPSAPSTAPVSGPLSDAQISALGRGRFAWPLKGDILSDFGPKGTGQRNDGINIRAHAGDPVRSAAAGDVVYAGDQVPGFGNLVLVKHADGWVTAYGHLGRVDVKMQQKVVQGQQIGQAGETGGVTEPQLHFEVRYAPTPTERARPVDPQLVLSK